MAQRLLDWYDVNARSMPWRVGPEDRKKGVIPDPYHIWLSEVMLQQTTVAAVKAYFEDFLSRWPSVRDLAAAEEGAVMAAWAGLGYYARARNLVKCARLVASELEGVFPAREEALLKLPGVGPYTAAAVASIAFDVPATVLDGNVERVMARMHAVLDPLPGAKQTLRALAKRYTPAYRAGDYAQAIMDLGATICTPAAPGCGICPWSEDCSARRQGLAAELPKKTRKPRKPLRLGVAYVGVSESGSLVFERRDAKGLLGGMLGWPGGDWQEGTVIESPPFDANWQDIEGEVRHTFTHFNLRLKIKYCAGIPEILPERSILVESNEFDPEVLPSVMRKVWVLAQDMMPRSDRSGGSGSPL